MNQTRILLSGTLTLSILAPFLIGLSVFLPVIGHYDTPKAKIGTDLVDQLSANVRDRRQELEELHAIRLIGAHEILLWADVISKATEILDGNISAPSHSGRPIQWPYSPEDIDVTSGALQLSLSALVPASILLDAYKQTGDMKFLSGALAGTEHFLDTEERLWMPRGLVWNDHAIAARSRLICRLLVAIALTNDSDKDRTIRRLLEALDRHILMLSDDRHFTFRSNHGLMQSIAVLHAAVLIPALPSVEQNIERVIGRTDHQLEFVVLENGVFTEHSSGYQEHNLNLLAQAIRLVTLLKGNLQERWVKRYANALEFYRHVRRPDGTLPRHGDSHGDSSPVLLGAAENGPLRLSSDPEFARQHVEPLWFDPASGYWSEWGYGSHTFMTWANFPSGVHKHADELSLHFWSMGEDWLTASGYWPYGETLRKPAVGWRGSNAPHALLESSSAPRNSILRAWYRDDEISLTHVQRKASNGYAVDRVLVRVGATWFSVDSAVGVDVPTSTVWQLSPTVKVDELSALQDTQTAVLRSSNSPSVLAIQALLGRGASLSQFSGEREPFGGWVMYDGVPSPAMALALSAPVGSWSGLAWKPVSTSSLPTDVLIRNIKWETPNQWIVEIAGMSPTTLERDYQRLIIRNGLKSREVSIDQLKGADAAGVEMAKQAYAEAERRYPVFRDFLPWRYNVFWLAIAAAILQLIVLISAWRWLQNHPQPGVYFLVSMIIAHCAFASWLHLVYFSTS